MAEYIELNLDQGSDFKFEADITNNDGTVVDCTGYSFASSLRKSYYSAKPTANMTVTIVNAASGNIAFSLSATQTANIKAGRYLFDVKQTDDMGKKTRLFEGIITVNPQVTK